MPLSLPSTLARQVGSLEGGRVRGEGREGGREGLVVAEKEG